MTFNPTSRLLPLAALSGPACAADGTGSGSVTIAVLLIAAAAVILAGLLLGQRVRPVFRQLCQRLGQRRMRRALGRTGLSRLDNFILPGNRDELARVDHAVLTAAGVVCIRVHHGNGLVFGAAGEPQWHSVDGVRRRQFLNPVIQNAGRVDALRRIVPELPVFSLVVFSGDVQFSRRPAENVIALDELPAWIEQHENQETACRDPQAAWMNLRAAARTDEASQRDFEAQVSFG